jgi:eukaryotic-like serine/threonine-protein kinase
MASPQPMPFSTNCPSCGASNEFADEKAGQTDRCQNCGATIELVPESRIGPPGDAADPPIPRGAEKLPSAIGSYRIVRELGRGAMGVVYLAKDPGLNRDVALKLPLKLKEHPGARERFLREARVAALFHHANFCPIHQIGEHEGDPYLVMAFIDGITLKNRIVRGEPWGCREAAELVHRLAVALSEAHRRGVVHRDLKPANIMIHSDGRLFLMDFGLARQIDSADPTLTSQGAIIGTPTYMPPEQVRGLVKEIGPRSDLYSLGVVFYELLTGRPPFEGVVWWVLHQVIAEAPPIPSGLNPAIDAALQAIVLKAMAKKPEDRYASMDEFAGELRGWLDTPLTPMPEKKPVVPAPKAPLPPARSPAILTDSLGVRPTPMPEKKPVVPASKIPPPLAASPAILTNTLGMKLALIPAGKFLMGSDSSDREAYDNEEPRHRVQITKPFYLGVYPVTQAEYRALTGQSPSFFKGADDLPVEQVSWFDAVAFCNQLSMKEGLRPCYDSRGAAIANGDGYRLPTEAEWEYACRARSATRYSFGHDPDTLGNHAWFNKNSDKKTHPVGRKQANAFGLYDMHGNVCEWCSDLFDNYYYGQSQVDDPCGPSDGSHRVIRGGGWINVAEDCRAAFRFRSTPTGTSTNLGFRVARVRSVS